ncbi:unnamed protein product [Psylliodes chrysocephalus]|uniref:Gag-like protein n=1 Tax=Psylliodes chrysocephalus TaxID=3402493 RepID=A0A9P0D4X9_9CUCU|nr:unnamed protein product [Psylliodes chrysocephala]
MGEPPGANTPQLKEYPTVYSQRQRNRWKQTAELRNIAKIQTPDNIKAKSRLKSSINVSKNTIWALTSDNTNPGVNYPKQGEPLAKISPVRPTNDPQTLLEEVYGNLDESSSSNESMDTTIKPATAECPQDPHNLIEHTDPKIIILSNNKVEESSKNANYLSESSENSHKSLENLHKIKDNIHKSLENIEHKETPHPNLNRTASDDKSEEYMDADDKALSPPRRRRGNEKEDHHKVLKNIQEEKIAYHTYTTKEDKSHAFVLRGLAMGTKIPDIEEDLDSQYEIKTRNVFLMNTKNRPLFLVVTDPSLTLDYLNKNVRIILHTRITWELRKSMKQIIQCHNCQKWGHATTNCGRPPRCLKCAGEHLTRTCMKSRETAAKCANCDGEHPANYSKCQAYLERLERLEDKRNMSKPTKYIQAPPPKINAWEAKKRQVPGREKFPELRSRGQYNTNAQTNPSQSTINPSQTTLRPNPPPRPNPTNPNGNPDDFQALNAELTELNRDDEIPKEQPAETLFTKRATEKEESRKALSLNTERRRSSGSSNSPRSPPTLKLKRSIHHSYKHVSTPKPREHKSNSSRDSRDSHSRSSKSHDKEGKKTSRSGTSKDREKQALITPICTQLQLMTREKP